MTKKELLEKIAKDVMDIETLEERKSDDLDFYDIAVWNLKVMMEKAYQAGLEAGKK